MALFNVDTDGTPASRRAWRCLRFRSLSYLRRSANVFATPIILHLMPHRMIRQTYARDKSPRHVPTIPRSTGAALIGDDGSLRSRALFVGSHLFDIEHEPETRSVDTLRA